MSARIWLATTTAMVLPVLAHAQAMPSDFTSATRYDILGRVVGMIAPDPDGSGPLHLAATRNIYDLNGFLIRVEAGELAAWQSEAVPPSAWTGYSPLSKVELAYDAMGRRSKETAWGWDGPTSTWIEASVTQYSYDLNGRVECTAVRMNRASWGALPASACVLGTSGADGPDRIRKNVYDATGHIVKIVDGYGQTLANGLEPLQQDYATYTYSNNGSPTSMVDANGNRATIAYDGFDREVAWIFPSKTVRGSSAGCTIGTISETLVNGVYVTSPSMSRTSGDDCEKYAYDRNGNKMKLAKRDGQVISYSYDALDRMTMKDIPGGTAADVYYGYDLRGLQLYARFASATGAGITQTYDGFGQLSSATNNMSASSKTLSYERDADGNRTKIVHPDLASFSYAFDGLDRTSWLYEGTSTVLAQMGYYNHGAPSYVSRASGSVSANYYDATMHLSAIQHDLSNTGQDVTYGFTSYNPAGQLTSSSRSNDSYAFNGYANVSRTYASNGLNQYSSAGATSFCYDDNGNLSSDGAHEYRYDAENRLVEVRNAPPSATCPAAYTGTITASLSYDPLGRLYQTGNGGSGVTRFLYDGGELLAEYDGSDTLLRRYVHGSSADQPLVWYEGSAVNTATRRFYYADRLGSVVAVADNSGAALAIDTYDEYGIPGAGNQGRFQYTGQAWIPEIGMYYYKARMYSPTLGRFMQVDPVGYSDQNNLYAYVANDPVNGRDPSGLQNCDPKDSSCIETRTSGLQPGDPPGVTPEQQQMAEIVVTAQLNKKTTDKKAIPLGVHAETFYVVTTESINSRPMNQKEVSCDDGSVTTVGRPVKDLAAGEAGAHTHSAAPGTDTVPGPGDNIAARGSTTHAAFLMTSHNAFMIRSFGNGTYAVNVLSGSHLTSDQVSQLQGYMEGWEGAAVNNTKLSDKSRFCPR